MNVLQSLVFDEVCHRRILRRTDVRAIRDLYGDNPAVCQTEIAALLTINQACFVQDPTWADFLVEALAAFVIHEMEPVGSVTAENAEWLVSAIAPSGVLTSHRLRECVVALLERVTPAPYTLRRFLLSSLRDDLGNRHGAMASVLARRPEAIEKQVAEVATVLLETIPAAGLELRRAELDILASMASLSHVAGSPTYQRMIETFAVISLLELGDYTLPDTKNLAAWIVDGQDRPWVAGPASHLETGALQLRELERQRTAIILGEPTVPASTVDFEAAWGRLDGYTAARRSLAQGGYDIPASTGSRSVNAA